MVWNNFCNFAVGKLKRKNMATITMQYNPRNKFAMALITLIKSSSEVKIIEPNATEKSPYKPEFVAKVKRGEKGKKHEVDLDKLWD